MGRKRSSYDYAMGFGVSARVAQKALGCSPSGQTTQRHRAAAYLQTTYAPDKSRIKQIFASLFAVCLFRLSRNPKPDESLNCPTSSEIRGLFHHLSPLSDCKERIRGLQINKIGRCLTQTLKASSGMTKPIMSPLSDETKNVMAGASATSGISHLRINKENRKMPYSDCKQSSGMTITINCHPSSEERARLGVYELVKTTKMPYSLVSLAQA